MKKNRIIGIIAIGLIVLILTLLIEVFVFNWNFITHGSKNQDITEITTNNLEILESGKYRILDNNASIKLNNIDEFVNKLQFNTDSFGKNVNIRISYNGKTVNNNIDFINEKSINIGEKVDSITISFVNATDQEISVNNFRNMNYFQINLIRVMMILLVMMLMGVIGFTLYKKGNIRLEVIFLIFVLSFGLANTIMIPVLYGWDDAEHFVKSYNLASGNIIMREGEAIEYPIGMGDFLEKKFQTSNPNYRTYEEFEVETDSLLAQKYSITESAYYPSMALTYTAVPYIFSAFGILVSKILNFPFIGSYYLGRFFNLIIYALTVFYAIKIIPMGKKLLFVCALLATVMFQATSFSADVVLNGFSFLAFAFVIKWLIDEKKLSIPDLLIMTGCFILITASKVTYAPIFLMVLLFKKNNFSSKKGEWIIKLSVLALGGLTFVAVFLYGQKLGLTQWEVPGISVREQLLFIIFTPLEYIKVIFQTFISQRDVLLGGSTVYLAYMGDLGRNTQIIIWLMLFGIALFDVDDKSSLLVMRDRGIILFTCLITLILTMTALYATFTPVRNQIVLGFQGRYLIPLIFPFLFLFQRKKWVVSFNTKIINIIVVAFSGTLLFSSVLYVFNLYYV
ncbi:DUF2142 domain-containing protein [Acetobacterium bakii]|uniref:DUF2142 domain-containing protein n=1 Tax=Acetobacterium bakii TaxID=52689 RepID=A0A0L6U413_9FIRM|nr:DUF2142 domain-containing protein [Acetobacterium bakii]KNZ43077.1 hypothetical protein AKG39_02670 [Acetobacterium bakii]